MKKIYLSGRITGLDYKEALVYFDNAAHKISLMKNHVPLNPMELEHNHDKSWESYMKECIGALLQCNSIFMLKGWEKSNGAKVELELARNLNFNVLFEA